MYTPLTLVSLLLELKGLSREPVSRGLKGCVHSIGNGTLEKFVEFIFSQNSFRERETTVVAGLIV